MQTTLAFAPAPEDFDDGLFDVPIVTLTPAPSDDEEPEPGEP